MFTNITHVTNFRLDIADNNGTKVFESAVQSAIIPSITISPAEVNVRGSVNQAAGSAIQFDPLNVRILLDEELKSYLDIYRWMVGIVNHKGFAITASTKTVFVHVLDNSKQNIVLTFRFNQAWPSVLGEIEYQYIEETNLALNCMITFMYSTFDILDSQGRIIGSYVVENTSDNKKQILPKMGMHPSMRS